MRAGDQPRAQGTSEACKLRMGVHSGPVSGVVDVSDQANIAGAGINMAQRVMDCGDAGHILVSRHVAEDLEAIRALAAALARPWRMRSETRRPRSRSSTSTPTKWAIADLPAKLKRIAQAPEEAAAR